MPRCKHSTLKEGCASAKCAVEVAADGRPPSTQASRACGAPSRLFSRTERDSSRRHKPRMASEERGPAPASAAPPPGQQPEGGEQARPLDSSRGRGGRAAAASPPHHRRHPSAAAAAFVPILSPLQAPGAEFFRRRLQRAMDIPPEQRDPAVHAFVTSVQLLNAADELLPLTAAGEPALPPDTLAGQRAEVQAMLLCLTASETAPDLPQWEGHQSARMGRYLSRRGRLAGGDSNAAYLPALRPLGPLLLQLFFTATDPAEAVRQWAAVCTDLARQPINAALRQQLRQLQLNSRYQLTSADQPEAHCHCRAVYRWADVFDPTVAADVAAAAGSQTA